MTKHRAVTVGASGPHPLGRPAQTSRLSAGPGAVLRRLSPGSDPGPGRESCGVRNFAESAILRSPQIGLSGWPGRSPGSGVQVVKPGSAWPWPAQASRAGAARALSSASNSGYRAAAARRCPDRTAGARHRVESCRRAAMPRASNHLHALGHESQLPSSSPNVTPLRRGGLEEGDAGRRKILPAGRGTQRAGLPGSATCRPAGGASETRKTD